MSYDPLIPANSGASHAHDYMLQQSSRYGVPPGHHDGRTPGSNSGVLNLPSSSSQGDDNRLRTGRRMIAPTSQAEGEAEKERRKREYKEELDKQRRDKQAHTLAQQQSPSMMSTPLQSSRNASITGYTNSPGYLGGDGNFGGNQGQGGFGGGGMQRHDSPDLRRASGSVSTMHWGEREVGQWHDQQAKMRQHKEDLERQIRDKAAARR
jgi:hypothetical protein